MEGMGSKKDMMKDMKSMARKSTPGIESKERGPDYPSITLEEHMMPEIKGMKMGDTCHMLVHAKVTGINKYGNGEIEYRFDLEKGDMVEMMPEGESKK